MYQIISKKSKALLIPHCNNQFLDMLEEWIRLEPLTNIINLHIIETVNLYKVRDLFGYEAEKAILQKVIDRLSIFTDYQIIATVLKDSTIGMVTKNIKNIEELWWIARAIEEQFKKPFNVNGTSIFLSPKIGFSSTSNVTDTAVTLFKAAKLALNKARLDLNSAVHTHIVKFYEELHSNSLIELELALALKNNNELEVYYQPKLALKTNTIIGLEALIRWEHPARGMLSPNLFIPIAEKTSLICDITDYVIAKVCQELPLLIENGLEGSVSVNISTKDLNRFSFVSNICSIVESYNIPPKLIDLEITESTLVDNLDQCIFAIQSLRNKGFSFSLDDFGTGYSSLSYLQKFPIQTLKIDMSFVRDIENSCRVKKIFCAILTLAEAYSLKVVAEGVENLMQKDVLAEIGCASIQGFLLSKPLPLENMCEFLSKFDGFRKENL